MSALQVGHLAAPAGAPGQVPRRRTTLPFRSIPMILWSVVFGLGLQVSPGLSVKLSSTVRLYCGLLSILHPSPSPTRVHEAKRWWTRAGEIRVTNRIQKEGTVLSGILY